MTVSAERFLRGIDDSGAVKESQPVRIAIEYAQIAIEKARIALICDMHLIPVHGRQRIDFAACDRARLSRNRVRNERTALRVEGAQNRGCVVDRATLDRHQQPSSSS
jgi:hypothetical protein